MGHARTPNTPASAATTARLLAALPRLTVKQWDKLRQRRLNFGDVRMAADGFHVLDKSGADLGRLTEHRAKRLAEIAEQMTRDKAGATVAG
jgi:hypothetical protein